MSDKKDIKSELGKLNKTVNSMDDKLGKIQQCLEKELNRYEKNLTKREHKLNGKVRKLKNSEENLKKRQEKLNANKVRKCTCCCASRIIIAVLIVVVCLVFSKCTLDAMKNCEITVNETTTFALDYDKNPAMPIINGKKATPAIDDTNFDNNRKRHRPPYHGKVVQEKTNMYPVFCMAYFVVLAGTIAALIVLFAKDDSWLKCAKLDELREIKENLLKGDFKNSKDETVEKNHSEETPVNSNAVKKTNKTTEITDQRAELLKHYMNCVADI